MLVVAVVVFTVTLGKWVFDDGIARGLIFGDVLIGKLRLLVNEFDDVLGPDGWELLLFVKPPVNNRPGPRRVELNNVCLLAENNGVWYAGLLTNVDEFETDGRAVEFAAANDRDRTRPFACAMEISRAVGRVGASFAELVVVLLLLLFVDGIDAVATSGGAPGCCWARNCFNSSKATSGILPNWVGITNDRKYNKLFFKNILRNHRKNVKNND